MATLTGTEIILVAFIVVLAVVVVGLLLFLLRRLRNRRAKILGELDGRPELSQDRAFNRLAMARREAGILAGQGVDVHRAQELIAESQGAFDTRQYNRAYEVAQSAHEALVNARQQGARVAGAPLPSQGLGTGPPSGTSGGATAAIGGPASPPPARPSIPKNRMESQFEIRLLGEELDALPPRRAQDPTGISAAALRREASAAFDKGDYTEALRLALRGRRALGGTFETLPPPGAVTNRPLPRTTNGGGAAPDLTETAESVAGGERCPECGYPALPGDAFCRGCGRPHAALTCPTCGTPRGGDEPYCGGCGSRFS